MTAQEEREPLRIRAGNAITGWIFTTMSGAAQAAIVLGVASLVFRAGSWTGVAAGTVLFVGGYLGAWVMLRRLAACSVGSATRPSLASLISMVRGDQN